MIYNLYFNVGFKRKTNKTIIMIKILAFNCNLENFMCIDNKFTNWVWWRWRSFLNVSQQYRKTEKESLSKDFLLLFTISWTHRTFKHQHCYFKFLYIYSLDYIEIFHPICGWKHYFLSENKLPKTTEKEKQSDHELYFGSYIPLLGFSSCDTADTL